MCTHLFVCVLVCVSVCVCVRVRVCECTQTPEVEASVVKRLFQKRERKKEENTHMYARIHKRARTLTHIFKQASKCTLLVC